jgi:hypothetical protein
MVKLGFVEFAAIVLAAAVLSPGVMAQPPSDTGTATLYQGAYSYDVGGEFTAVTAPNLASGYASGLVLTPTVKGLTGFQTFCIQTAVDFTPGTTYNYSTSLASVGSPDAFALKEGTAWLYGEFATGNLGSYYNYANTGTGPSRLVDAGLLQAAIWALQGGQAYSDGNYASLASTEASNPYYLLAESALGANLEANVTAANYAQFGVEVLNLYSGSTPSSGPAQNQLVYLGGATQLTPLVPDGGATLTLLGAGLAGLAVFSRRLNVAKRIL